MAKLKYRLLLIGACVLLSAWALMPRQVVERSNRGGTVVYDTLRRTPLKLGLDLRGGMHVELEIDESQGSVADKADAIDKALKVVRTRIDEFGVSEPIVQKSGNDRIVVELPGMEDPERAKSLLQKNAFLTFQITDETQALERVAGRLDAILKERGITQVSLSDSGQSPTKVSIFTKVDSAARDSTAVDSTASGIFSTKVGNAGVPGVYRVAEGDYPLFERALRDSAVQSALPPGKVLRWGADSVGIGYRTLYMLDERPIIDGGYLLDARPQQDPVNGTLVSFEFNSEGGRIFRNQTGKHVHDYMAIVLDDKVMSAPTIQEAIGARGQITLGPGRSIAEAQDLALVLRAGSLPVPLRIAQVRTIGPSLGADSIHDSVRAGVIAIALIVLVMAIYYKFSGLLAIVSLLLYVLFTLAILASFNATLTLPGLAGFVLSIGIAVDANILIFERIREELVGGKTVRLAIDEGFKHAWNAIIDSAVSTALTAAVLYQFGTGSVRGFAVTLLAGIVASLFTAIFVVRTFYLVYLTRKREGEALSI
jgi:preprotein translocase subunit SecD